MKQLFTFLLVAISSIIVAQVPQSIPYQAVVRNTDGSVMASTSITMTFKIHVVSATGTVVYEETHSTSSNTQGLVSLNVGAGTAVTGTFASINWGSGAKFLHVLMNTGSGNVDLGTQQMMSVPYALYAEKANTTNVSVSAVGDTLYLGNGNYILVPGISNSNKTVDTGLGNQLLPGVTYCADKTISASGCDGLTTLEYQGFTYDLVEIAGQCWFKENLRASSFNDGTPIAFASNISSATCSGIWSDVSASNPQAYYGYYYDDLQLQAEYGNIYNSSCLINENICPIGWHVPTLCDFHYLSHGQGVSISEINSLEGNVSDHYGANAYLTGRLLDTDTSIWNPTTPLFMPNNSSGLSIKLGGYRSGCGDVLSGGGSDFWIFSPDEIDGWFNLRQVRITPSSLYPDVLFLNSSRFNSLNNTFYNGIDNQGYYIRCIKD
jgi:uncharacterized protein (TIGR02145 family)